MDSSQQVDVQVTQLYEVIERSNDEPIEAAAKLYAVCRHMESTGKGNSLTHQVMLRALGTIVRQHGLSMDAVRASVECAMSKDKESAVPEDRDAIPIQPSSSGGMCNARNSEGSFLGRSTPVQIRFDYTEHDAQHGSPASFATNDTRTANSQDDNDSLKPYSKMNKVNSGSKRKRSNPKADGGLHNDDSTKSDTMDIRSDSERCEHIKGRIQAEIERGASQHQMTHPVQTMTTQDSHLSLYGFSPNFRGQNVLMRTKAQSVSEELSSDKVAPEFQKEILLPGFGEFSSHNVWTQPSQDGMFSPTENPSALANNAEKTISGASGGSRLSHFSADISAPNLVAPQFSGVGAGGDRHDYGRVQFQLNAAPPEASTFALSKNPFNEQQLRQLKAQCFVFVSLSNNLTPQKPHLAVALGGAYPLRRPRNDSTWPDGSTLEPGSSHESSGMHARSNEIPRLASPAVGVTVDNEASSKEREITVGKRMPTEPQSPLIRDGSNQMPVSHEATQAHETAFTMQQMHFQNGFGSCSSEMYYGNYSADNCHKNAIRESSIYSNIDDGAGPPDVEGACLQKNLYHGDAPGDFLRYTTAYSIPSCRYNASLPTGIISTQIFDDEGKECSMMGETSFDALRNEDGLFETCDLPESPPKFTTCDKWIMDYKKRNLIEREQWELKRKNAADQIAVRFHMLKEHVISLGNIPSKTRTVIELKKLQLLQLQHCLRSAFTDDFFKNKMPEMENVKMIKKNKHARRSKQLERIEQRMKEERLKRARERQKEFFAEMEAHRVNLEDCFKVKRERLKVINRYVKELHRKRERSHREKNDRIQQKKINLLKNNDVEGYLRMVKDAKSDRVKQLLKETEKYLLKLSSKLQKTNTKARPLDMDAGVNQGGKKTDFLDDIEDENYQAQHYLESNENYYQLAHSVKEIIDEQPAFLQGGKLREYQMHGLRWLVSLYNNNLNGILADEMGLGKTIQVISLLCYLMEKKNDKGPFLVVVPSSVLPGWVSELSIWAPHISRIVYAGPPEERRRLFRESIHHQRFNVLLTTYEYLMSKYDRPKLSKIHWHYIIIDEGHRIKNASCKLNAELKHYRSYHRLLLTGTPMQNNLEELWALLNFLLPDIFNSSEDFSQWFSKPFRSGIDNSPDEVLLSEEENLLIINRLHQVLRPFVLRRLKHKVEHELPEKIERLVRCEASAYQKLLMKRVKEKIGGIGNTKVRVQNIVMEMRNICNHPFISQLHVQEIENHLPKHYLPSVIRLCGKLEMLDRLLPKLKATGHRILFFSTMTRLLDVMEDYLIWKHYKYLRLDGHTSGLERGALIEQFNNPMSEAFIFLLSIRAGGVGLNLQVADTVIIFDTDWNPQVDLQAQARAHRIGQKKDVLVLRLETARTVEEHVRAAAEHKLGVANQSITAGFFDNNTSAEDRREYLESLLRESKREEAAPVLDDDALNNLLARSDSEIDIFESIDAQRREEEMSAWQKMIKEGLVDKAVASTLPSRLVTDEDLQSFYGVVKLHDSSKTMANAKGVAKRKSDSICGPEVHQYGRGKRAREIRSYEDRWTEEEFEKICLGNAPENIAVDLKDQSELCASELEPLSPTPEQNISPSEQSNGGRRGAKGRVRGRGRGRGRRINALISASSPVDALESASKPDFKSENDTPENCPETTPLEDNATPSHCSVGSARGSNGSRGGSRGHRRGRISGSMPGYRSRRTKASQDILSCAEARDAASIRSGEGQETSISTEIPFDSANTGQSEKKANTRLSEKKVDTQRNKVSSQLVAQQVAPPSIPVVAESKNWPRNMGIFDSTAEIATASHKKKKRVINIDTTANVKKLSHEKQSFSSQAVDAVKVADSSEPQKSNLSGSLESQSEQKEDVRYVRGGRISRRNAAEASHVVKSCSATVTAACERRARIAARQTKGSRKLHQAAAVSTEVKPGDDSSELKHSTFIVTGSENIESNQTSAFSGRQSAAALSNNEPLKQSATDSAPGAAVIPDNDARECRKKNIPGDADLDHPTIVQHETTCTSLKNEYSLTTVMEENSVSDSKNADQRSSIKSPSPENIKSNQTYVVLGEQSGAALPNSEEQLKQNATDSAQAVALKSYNDSFERLENEQNFRTVMEANSGSDDNKVKLPSPEDIESKQTSVVSCEQSAAPLPTKEEPSKQNATDSALTAALRPDNDASEHHKKICPGDADMDNATVVPHKTTCTSLENEYNFTTVMGEKLRSDGNNADLSSSNKSPSLENIQSNQIPVVSVEQSAAPSANNEEPSNQNAPDSALTAALGPDNDASEQHKKNSSGDADVDNATVLQHKTTCTSLENEYNFATIMEEKSHTDRNNADLSFSNESPSLENIQSNQTSAVSGNQLAAVSPNNEEPLKQNATVVQLETMCTSFENDCTFTTATEEKSYSDGNNADLSSSNKSPSLENIQSNQTPVFSAEQLAAASPNEEEALKQNATDSVPAAPLGLDNDTSDCHLNTSPADLDNAYSHQGAAVISDMKQENYASELKPSTSRVIAFEDTQSNQTSVVSSEQSTAALRNNKKPLIQNATDSAPAAALSPNDDTYWDAATVVQHETICSSLENECNFTTVTEEKCTSDGSSADQSSSLKLPSSDDGAFHKPELRNSVTIELLDKEDGCPDEITAKSGQDFMAYDLSSKTAADAPAACLPVDTCEESLDNVVAISKTTELHESTVAASPDGIPAQKFSGAAAQSDNVDHSSSCELPSSGGSITQEPMLQNIPEAMVAAEASQDPTAHGLSTETAAGAPAACPPVETCEELLELHESAIAATPDGKPAV